MTSYNRLDALPIDCLMIVLSYADKFLKEYNTIRLINSGEFQEKYKERFLTSEDYDNVYHQDFKMLFLHNQLFKRLNMSSFYIEESEYSEDVFYVEIKKRKTIIRKADKKLLCDKFIIEKEEYEFKGEEQIKDDVIEHYGDEPSLIPTCYLYDNLIKEVRKKGMDLEDINALRENEMNNVLSAVCDINEAVDDYIAREGLCELLELNVIMEIEEDEANDKLGNYERYYLIKR
jgi:hypothetical protein